MRDEMRVLGFFVSIDEMGNNKIHHMSPYGLWARRGGKKQRNALYPRQSHCCESQKPRHNIDVEHREFDHSAESLEPVGK